MQIPGVKKDLKIALVHDFLVNYGGAERVLETLSEMFPEAPIYTLLYDQEKMRGKFSKRDVRTSFLQKFPRILRRRFKFLLPFLPTAPETLDLREFDLIISSSGAWSKGIVTKLNTLHVAYIHSPMRFVWDYNERYLKEKKTGFLSFPVRLFLNYLRVWDKLAADRPDYLIANSAYTQKRIRKYYGRESEVIYPPVGKKFETQSTKSENKKEYFLIVSRLSAYKKVDVAVEAFNKLDLPLVIVGEGEQEKYLRSIAKENVKILGWQSDEELEKHYQKARAFIFPGEDDFGMAPVEAMIHGVPVIALRKGGAKETVLQGKTGELFEAPTPEVLADGVRRFRENEDKYIREEIISAGKKFSQENFRESLFAFLEKIMTK